MMKLHPVTLTGKTPTGKLPTGKAYRRKLRALAQPCAQIYGGGG